MHSVHRSFAQHLHDARRRPAAQGVGVFHRLVGLAAAAAALGPLCLALAPVALAILLAFLLAPVVRRLESWRLGRTASTLLAVALGFSLIGGIAETQEMLDFCAKHGIVSDIELIDIQSINEAYERMLRSDVKYRFVIDMKSLK